MGYLPLDKVPRHLKLGSRRFDASMYINLVEDTTTCKTGGFFYAYEDSWLDFAIRNEYYEEFVLWPGKDGYFYAPSVTLHSVKINSERYIAAKNVESGDIYPNKILIVKDLADAKNFQKLFGREIEGEKDCEIDWTQVKACFGGFETRLDNVGFKDLQDNQEFSWLRWWYAKSGVIWNFKLIDEIKEIKNYTPPMKKIRYSGILDNEMYMILTDKPFIDLNDVLSKKGIEFYGPGSEIMSNATYKNYVEFKNSEKILVLDHLRDFDMSLESAREKYSAIFCRETRKGLLFNIDIIKFTAIDIT